MLQTGYTSYLYTPQLKTVSYSISQDKSSRESVWLLNREQSCSQTLRFSLSTWTDVLPDFNLQSVT